MWMVLAAAMVMAPDQAAIEAAMADSAAGWNAGDVDRFMRVYSDAPEASFVTADGLVRGKSAMIARYTLTYADGRTVSGPTSLVFRREKRGWKIVADHSG